MVAMGFRTGWREAASETQACSARSCIGTDGWAGVRYPAGSSSGSNASRGRKRFVKKKEGRSGSGSLVVTAPRPWETGRRDAHVQGSMQELSETNALLSRMKWPLAATALLDRRNHQGALPCARGPACLPREVPRHPRYVLSLKLASGLRHWGSMQAWLMEA